MGDKGKSDEDDAALRARLESLSRQLAQKKEGASAPPPAQSNFGPSAGPETKPRP